LFPNLFAAVDSSDPIRHNPLRSLTRYYRRLLWRQSVEALF